MLYNWFDEPLIAHWLERQEIAARRRVQPIVPLAVRGGDEAPSAADVAPLDGAPLLPPLEHEPAEGLVARSTALDADR